MIGTPVDRSRAVWWLLLAVFSGIGAFVFYSYVGTFVLALFVYYAARPVTDRVRLLVGSRSLAAAITVLAFVIPLFAVGGYVVLLALRGLESFAGNGADVAARFLPASTAEVERAMTDPVAYVSGLEGETILALITGGADVLEPVAAFALHLALAVSIAFFLLRDGHRLAAWIREEAGEESALWAYLTLVDRDLRVVYFGNVRTVIGVAVLAIAVFNGLNAVAPAGLHIPAPNLLALMTGAATLIPVVVGKVVYVPVSGYLAIAAVQSNPAALWFPLLVAGVSLVALDLFPIMVLRPFLAGETTHRGLMMLSYIFGGLTFGWYGIFLGPLLLVGAIHFVRVAFTELVTGEDVSPRVRTAHGLGSMPPLEERGNDTTLENREQAEE